MLRLEKRAVLVLLLYEYEFKTSSNWNLDSSVFPKMLWSSLLVLGLVQLGTSRILLKRWDNLALKHAWPAVPHGWGHIAPAPSNLVLKLRLGLKQNRIDDLIDNLIEISDPTNPRYIACLLLAFTADQYSDILNI